MNRSLTRAAALAAAVLVLAACSSSSKSTSSTTAAPATSPPTTVAATTTTAAGPMETITPNTGLKDAQVVQIVGKGEQPNTQYQTVECADKGTATGAGDCDLHVIKLGTSDATGTVTIAFPVVKGPFGSNNVTCSAAQACLVSLAPLSSPTNAITASITFA